MTALVTGSAGGIGAAIVRKLTAEGLQVKELDLVHGFDVADASAWEHVGSVDPNARQAVADRLVRECRRRRLRRERCRDRPVVVVAEEDQRRAHDACEVRTLVERTLGRGAVAEVGDRHRPLAAQLLPPGQARRVRNVRPDRDARESAHGW